MEVQKAEDLSLRLEAWFDKVERTVVALSGGIDSSLVAYVSRRMLGQENARAIISASASVKQRELNDARYFCTKYDINLIEVDAREIDDPNYRENPVNRCFFCKSALYSEMDRIIAEKFPGFAVLNGNNFSDLGDFRPGLQAAEQHKVFSPLAESRFTKDDIRKVAKYYGLPNWDKPASPCLSSRFPYGEGISVEKLKMVEKAEDLLNDFGFSDVRVRYINNVARIEVPADELDKLHIVFDDVLPSMQSYGFTGCEIDNEGLVSGKLNRAVQSKPSKGL